MAGMQFIHSDLGSRQAGDVVEVTLTSGANVRLMDSSNFNAYRNGRQHRYVGGIALERLRSAYESRAAVLGTWRSTCKACAAAPALDFA